MFIQDLSTIREDRQKLTNINLAELLCHTETFTDKELKPFMNFKELDRLCNVMKLTREDIFSKCSGNYEFALVVAHGCSILASRQGSKDESFVLTEINKETSKVGTTITALNNQDLRPTKDGRVLNKKQFSELKKVGFSKLDCLKSFDGIMKGEVEGYIFAKIVYGEGGHQDNVIIESSEFADWANEYGDKDKVYVILIDTDRQRQYNELKDKYDSSNVWIVDHVELQKRLGVK